MPKNLGELLDKVAGAYKSLFKCSAGKSEPVLMDDVAYFKRAEDDISSSWTVGKAMSLELRRDGISKRAEDKYHNFGKFFVKRQIVDGAARSLLRLFNTKDSTLKEVEKVVKPSKDFKANIDLAWNSNWRLNCG